MKKDKGNICTECVQKLSIQGLLSDDDDVRELTSQFAGELCVVCETNITGGNGRNIDYPEQIAVLLDKRFENYGGRFGGVVPIIDSGREETQISEAFKRSDPVRTQYDPVVITLQADESDIYQELIEFLESLSHIGRIRYTTEEFRDEDDELLGYEVTAFAAQ